MENIENIPAKPNASVVSEETGRKISIRVIYLIIAIIGITITAVAILAIAGLKTSPPPTTKSIQPAKISGVLNINGVVPQGATIAIGQRKFGETNFSIVAQKIDPLDGNSWLINNANSGSDYDLQGYLQINGKNIAASDILTITAPATNEVLSFNIKGDSPSNEKAIISGTFDLNGYVPEGSLIVLTQTAEGKVNEVVIDNDINPMDKGNWIFDSAIKGTTYTLVAYLKNQGKTVGKSEPLIVTAPAANEILRINSFATPPATPTPISSTATPILSGSQNISGTINLNGPVLANTKIVVFERVNGTSQFLVAADNIAPTDNAGWSWNNAVRGTTYELMAVLKQHQASTNTDTDLAYSQRLIVAAPAANEVLTINTNLSIPPPSSNPSVSCNNQLASGQWNITASYNTVANANQYWLEVGTQSGGNDVLNYFGNQANQNPQSTNATVNNNTTYYTRYAYAFCSGCTNTSLFSGFSATISFSCPQGVIPTITPTPAWTGYVCNLGSGCQLTKDPNPPYSFTNAGLLQCQADCKVAPTATPTSAPTLTPTPIPPTNTPTLTPTNTPIPTDTPTPIPPTNSLLTP